MRRPISKFVSTCSVLTVLAAVLLIAALVSFNRRDIAYTLVILWALVGIAVKHFAVTLVATASLITAALVAVILIYNLFGRKTAQK